MASRFCVLVLLQVPQQWSGGPGGIFVHENHLKKLPQMAGWWCNDPNDRFSMEKAFVPVSNADGFQMVIPPF